MICAFGRMHTRIEELEVEIAKRKEDLEKINDAADEVYIAEDIKFVYGEAFITMDCDAVSTRLDQRKTTLTEELEKFQTELDNLNEKTKEMKGKLYAKFGSQIYLERD